MHVGTKGRHGGAFLPPLSLSLSLSVVMIKTVTFVYWHAALKDKQPACYLLYLNSPSCILDTLVDLTRLTTTTIPMIAMISMTMTTLVITKMTQIIILLHYRQVMPYRFVVGQIFIIRALYLRFGTVELVGSDWPGIVVVSYYLLE